MPFDKVSEFLKSLLNGDFGIEVKEVRRQEKSGVIYVPKSYIGKKVVLVFKNEDEEEDK